MYIAEVDWVCSGIMTELIFCVSINTLSVKQKVISK